MKNCWVVEYKLKGEKEWEAEKWFPITEAVSINGQLLTGMVMTASGERRSADVRYQNRVWGEKIKYRYRGPCRMKDDFDKSKEHNWIFREQNGQAKTVDD